MYAEYLACIFYCCIVDAELKFMPYVLGRHGFGDYSSIDLQKYLAGKVVSLSYGFGDYTRKISGWTTPKDLPSLMELVYCAFTDFSLTDEDYNATVSIYENLLPNQESNPEYLFSKYINLSIYENPRKHVLTVDDIKDSEKGIIETIVKMMTANAADYTFIFVGNVDAESLRPMIEKYIASLPSNPKSSIKEQNLYGIDVKSGIETHSYSTKMETPQTWVYIDKTAAVTYDIKNSLMAEIAGMILSDRLLAKVREEMGAVYSIGAEGFVQPVGNPNAHIITAFPMKPEFKDEVLAYITSEFKNMETSVTENEVRKAAEFISKSHKENSARNEYLFSGIQRWLQSGQDMISSRLEVLNTITVDDIQAFMRQVNSQNNCQTVTLNPDK